MLDLNEIPFFKELEGQIRNLTLSEDFDEISGEMSGKEISHGEMTTLEKVLYTIAQNDDTTFSQNPVIVGHCTRKLILQAILWDSITKRLPQILNHPSRYIRNGFLITTVKWKH